MHVAETMQWVIPNVKTNMTFHLKADILTPQWADFHLLTSITQAGDNNNHESTTRKNQTAGQHSPNQQWEHMKNLGTVSSTNIMVPASLWKISWRKLWPVFAFLWWHGRIQRGCKGAWSTLDPRQKQSNHLAWCDLICIQWHYSTPW